MAEQQTPELSVREREILRLVATGASNKEIAQQLVISANTVKVHLRNIFSKIGAASRTEAAMHAVRLGLVRDTALVVDETPEREPLASLAPENLPAAENPSLLLDPLEAQKIQAQGSILRWRWAIVSALIVIILLVMGLVWVNTRPPAIAATDAPSTPTPAPRWQELAEMPTARFGLAAALYDGKIYAIGGESSVGVTGANEQYDPATNSWIALAPKPLPVADINTAAIGGRIYVPGGRLANSEITAALEIYDPREDDWVRGADLPRPLSAYALAAFEGRLYLFGGWDGQAYANTVYAYDPLQDAWQEHSAMPVERGYAGAAVIGGQIFVIGGRNQSGELDLCYTFDPSIQSGDAWQQVNSLPAQRAGIAVTSMADRVYVVGGEGDPLADGAGAVYDQQTGLWTLEDFDLPVGFQAGIVIRGQYLEVMGGKQNSAPSGKHLIYQVIYTISIPVIVK